MSRSNMKKGSCEITGIFLYSGDVHCHHLLPLHLGGDDTFHNLHILHKVIHKSQFVLSTAMRRRINHYRKMSNLEPIQLQS